MTKDFLPITKEDMDKRGWDQLDFIFISGDAYVDHPSFGHAIITRILESKGFKIGIIPQPDWNNPDSFSILGKPKLGVLISSGNLDSMVNHYTVSKKIRNDDSYSPGGKSGNRPDRAIIVYTNMVRRVFGKIPIIIGGIEASLRRFAHYDYWDNKVRKSILIDSGADILVYGMGEKQICDIAQALKEGKEISDIKDLRGTVYAVSSLNKIENHIECHSFNNISNNKKAYAEAFRIQYEQQDPVNGKTVIQNNGKRYIVQNPPEFPLSTNELDNIYSLPYMRNYHPSYEKLGGVPSINEVKFSITSSRGCFGGCSFCALTFHQGRTVSSRSKKSIIKEAEKLVWEPDFKGYIHDVGGPTANFRNPSCEKQIKNGICKDKHCLYPNPCSNLSVDHKEYLEILRDLKKIPQIKKVFIRSGIRFDYLMYDKDEEFFYELVSDHISGQLKVAPEHISSQVLKYMGKPKSTVYKRFVKRFKEINKELNKEQYIVPYFMSSHPGSTLKDAIKLAEYLRDIDYYPQQVQDFYPTPGTLSTCMFFTGLDPRTMEKVYVARSYKEKSMQRALIQYRNPKNYNLVYQALLKAGRKDLIGFNKKCLIRPKRYNKKKRKNNKRN